jgi:hypothetical protein
VKFLNCTFLSYLFLFFSLVGLQKSEISNLRRAQKFLKSDYKLSEREIVSEYQKKMVCVLNRVKELRKNSSASSGNKYKVEIKIAINLCKKSEHVSWSNSNSMNFIIQNNAMHLKCWVEFYDPHINYNSCLPYWSCDFRKWQNKHIRINNW